MSAYIDMAMKGFMLSIMEELKAFDENTLELYGLVKS